MTVANGESYSLTHYSVFNMKIMGITPAIWAMACPQERGMSQCCLACLAWTTSMRAMDISTSTITIDDPELEELRTEIRTPVSSLNTPKIAVRFMVEFVEEVDNYDEDYDNSSDA